MVKTNHWGTLEVIVCQKRLTVRAGSHPAEGVNSGSGCVCGDQGVWDFSLYFCSDFAGNLNLLKIED